MDYLEEQNISSKFLLIIFLIFSAAMLTGVIVSIGEINSASGEYLNMVYLAVFMLLLQTSIFYFLFRMKLVTEINKDGFHYSYSPIIRKKKLIDFNDMVSWKLKSKENFKEFISIGYKKNTFNKRTSFMMGGNEYLEIITKSNHTYIFSTNNYYPLTSALRKYCSQKEL